MSNMLRAMGIGPNQRTIANFWYVQTAAYATPIPLVYGQNRVAASMIHMPAQPVAGKSGKFGKTGKATNYTAPVIFAICEGPITGINLLWVDKDQPQLFASGWILNQANEPGTIPASGPYTFTVAFTSGGLGWYSDVSVYDSTAGVFLTAIPPNASPAPAAGQYQLDGTSNGKYYFNAAQANHGIWITWFYHSQGAFPGAWVLKLGTTPTQTVWSALAAYPGQGVTYPGIAYMAHPAANFPGDSPQQFSYEVEALNQFGGGIVDANGADILTDFLTNALHGANFPAASLGQLSGFAGSYYNYVAASGLFCSPVYNQQQAAHQHLQELFEVTNSAPYWSDGLLKVVPYGDTAVTANGFTYTPNTTPLYSLGDKDFLPNRNVPNGGSGAEDRGSDLDPILITRKDPSLIPNKVKVEYVSRTFDYNSDFVVAEDQISEALNGPIELSSLSLRSITEQSVARTVAQLRLQREQLIMPIQYQFIVGWKYTALEPMDLVELTDTNLGLIATPVRITSVEEMTDEEGFSLTAEPWPLGTANAVLYPSPGGMGSRPATNAIPGGTTGAFIIEGPTALISAPMELWIGAYGGANWGGCQVWISTDNVNFQNVGTINGTAAFGTMQPSGLASAGGAVYPTVDTTNTGTVTIATGRQLASLSASDFAGITYPCIIVNNAGANKEWMTYETAALVTGTEYNISNLYRGLYGTALASHVAAENFMLIDGSVAKIPWPNGVTGQTLYIKLPAFNTYGAQLEQLSAVTAFTYVIGGSPIVGAEPTLQVVAQVSSVAGNTTVIGVYVVDPAGTSETISITYANSNFATVIDVGTGLTLANPFTVTAGGTAKLIQLTPNIAFSGNCSLLFTGTAAGRTNGYATFTVGPAAQNAAPLSQITIAPSTSLTTSTAKASAFVSGPSNAASCLWLASTSSAAAVSRANVIASGASVSAGAPVFSIADLGVNLNIGDTVWLGVVYYDSASNAMTYALVSATRFTTTGQKTTRYQALAYMTADQGGNAFSFTIVLGYGFQAFGGTSTAGVGTPDNYTIAIPVALGATLNAVRLSTYTFKTWDQVTMQVQRQDSNGSATQLGSTQTALHAGFSTLAVSGLTDVASTGRSYTMPVTTLRDSNHAFATPACLWFEIDTSFPDVVTNL